MPINKKTSGFTLLEIIIALFIFSIVSIIMSSALHNTLNHQAAMEKNSERLSKLQIALLMMSRDIEQTIYRPIANAAGTSEGYTGTPQVVTFVHTGLSNPLGQARRSTLQRVRYQFSEHRLVRETWLVLDPAKNNTPQSRTLLDDVTDLSFEYLDSKGHFQKVWPPLEQQSALLPRAVRVTLVMKNWGKIHQIYVIVGQPLEKPN